jgi:hypothetical protein
MRPQARREHATKMMRRYRKADRAECSRLLDEFTEMTGQHRKWPITILRRADGPKPERRGRFGPEVVEACCSTIGSAGPSSTARSMRRRRPSPASRRGRRIRLAFDLPLGLEAYTVEERYVAPTGVRRAVAFMSGGCLDIRARPRDVSAPDLPLQVSLQAF